MNSLGQSWISREEVETILTPHHGQLRACVEGGWTKWMTEVKPRYPRPTRRLRANAVWDGMVDEARVRFNDVPGVAILDRADRFLLMFDGRILVRFKKLDDKLRTSNVPTQYSLQLDAQINLPEVPDGSMLTVGYRVNEMAMEIKDVLVVMSRSKKVIWSYDLNQSDNDNLVVPMPLPEPGGSLGKNRFRRVEREEGTEDS